MDAFRKYYFERIGILGDCSISESDSKDVNTDDNFSDSDIIRDSDLGVLDENTDISYDPQNEYSELSWLRINEVHRLKQADNTVPETRDDNEDISLCETVSAPSSEFRVDYLRELSKQGVWVPPHKQPPRHQTIIIFDWDDTLLCSGFISSKPSPQWTPKLVSLFKRLDKQAATVLRSAVEAGQTFIITNATAGWVEFSAKKFLPTVEKLLSQITVISARSDHESEFPDNVSEWKNAAFLSVQRKLYDVVTNIVSIGDSHFEIDAVHNMGAEFQYSLVKTIKFREDPSPEELIRQLELLEERFKYILAGSRNLKVTLVLVPGAKKK